MVIGVTGATGFLGRHVTKAAETAGHAIIGFSRVVRSAGGGVTEWRVWPSHGPPDVSGCDAVIHLAGESVMGFWTAGKRAAIRASRVEGTRQIVQAIGVASDTPRALVCASAIGYYGDRGDEALDESAAPGTGFLAEVTQAWEAEALGARSAGVRVVRGRIGLVLGADGGAYPKLRRVFRWGLGGRLGSGRQWMSWVHVEDAARLLVTAAGDARYEGAVNVVSPAPLTNADFTRGMARSLRRPALAPVPGLVLRAVLGEQSRLFLDSQRVMPEAARRLGYRYAFPELDGALADLR